MNWKVQRFRVPGMPAWWAIDPNCRPALYRARAERCRCRLTSTWAEALAHALRDGAR